jgi:hypothetical protein
MPEARRFVEGTSRRILAASQSGGGGTMVQVAATAF